MDTQSIVQTLNLVHVEVRSVSGTVSKADVAGNEVFTSGAVRYLAPEHLRDFSRIRQRAARICRQSGTRLLGAWAVPDNALCEVKAQLAVLEGEASSARADLCANVDQWCRQWADQHPEILPYAGHFPSNPAIVSSTGMVVSIYKLAPADTVDTGIETHIDGLAGRVLSEIAADVRDAFAPGAKMAKEASRDIVYRMRDKLTRFEFIDTRLGKVAELITTVMGGISATGPIKGIDFIAFRGLLSALQDPDGLFDVSAENAKTPPVLVSEILGSSATAQSLPQVSPLDFGTTVHDASIAGTEVAHDTFDGMVPEQAVALEFLKNRVTDAHGKPAASDKSADHDPVTPPASLPNAPHDKRNSAWDW